ncbi:hypothetical protein ACHAWF_012675 [Thalassiosira exigua]
MMRPLDHWFPPVLIGAILERLLLAAGTDGSSPHDFENEDKSDATLNDVSVQMFDAVIVGAGWAGIKAAEVLIDEGIDNILILEANNYIGGRSKTMNSDGSINVPNPNKVSHKPIDLGSEWLYDNTITLGKAWVMGI